MLFKKADDLLTQERMCKSNEKALKNRCANDAIRRHMVQQWFNDLNLLEVEWAIWQPRKTSLKCGQMRCVKTRSIFLIRVNDTA